MRITISNDRMVVLDDVFSQGTVRETYERLLELDMVPIGFGTLSRGRSVWRLHDGAPLQSTTAASLPAVAGPHAEPGSVLGRIAMALRDAAIHAEHLVGRPAIDWRSLALSSFVYRAGDSASLHVDGMRRFTGSVIAYFSPEWKPQWGGHLLVFGRDTRLAWGAHDGETAMQAHVPAPNALLGPGIVASHYCPVCIIPVPGRVVFLGSDVPHMVTELSARAGEALRVTASGFFARSS